MIRQISVGRTCNPKVNEFESQYRQVVLVCLPLPITEVLLCKTQNPPIATRAPQQKLYGLNADHKLLVWVTILGHVTSLFLWLFQLKPIGSVTHPLETIVATYWWNYVICRKVHWKIPTTTQTENPCETCKRKPVVWTQTSEQKEPVFSQSHLAKTVHIISSFQTPDSMNI